jgi:putative phosphoesterase
MRVGIVSDTHAPRRWKSCPPRVADHLSGVDLILHAGDVCIPDVLEELSALAPVRAVLGNNDGPEVASWGAPERLDLTLDGVRIGMIHDSGQATGRTPRMRSAFPEADLVIFGHSHIPWDVTDPATAEHRELRLFNPGSPTDKRRQPYGTLGILEVSAGRIEQLGVVRVTD